MSWEAGRTQGGQSIPFLQRTVGPIPSPPSATWPGGRSPLLGDKFKHSNG